MDRIEEEIKKILHRKYPKVREIKFIITSIRGRMYIFTDSPEVWVFRTSERWITRLHRAAYSEDLGGLPRELETYFRQKSIHAQVSKRVNDYISWKQQSTAQDKKRARVSLGGNRRGARC